MTVIHVLPKRFEDFLRHLDCNSPKIFNTKTEAPGLRLGFVLTSSPRNGMRPQPSADRPFEICSVFFFETRTWPSTERGLNT